MMIKAGASHTLGQRIVLSSACETRLDHGQASSTKLKRRECAIDRRFFRSLAAVYRLPLRDPRSGIIHLDVDKYFNLIPVSKPAGSPPTA
jgi:hypothetical protein